MTVGEILLQQGAIDQEQYEALVAASKTTNAPLEVLAQGLVTTETLFKAVAASLGLEYIDLTEQKIRPEVLEFIPKEIAETYQVCPFEFKDDLLQVAMLQPRNMKAKEAVDFIVRQKKVKVKYFVVSEVSFAAAVGFYDNVQEAVSEAVTAVNQKTTVKKTALSELKVHKIKDAPVAKIASVILRQAVEMGASDIHLEPLNKETRVRYRIDGKLEALLRLPPHVHSSLVSRIKVLAKLKLDQTRVPQDGRIRLSLPDKTVDFRVSVLPLQDQEKVVMRVLDTSGKTLKLEQLGYVGRNFQVLQRNIVKPNGLLLVTGPTGSGKSKTLFSILSLLNTGEVNISTLEDPVEYRLNGVNQSQVHPEVGFTFANGLRSLLRQDPDIIMVGEIRDKETAELAIHAAMTGHLVLATLHTNSALGAIPRLLDMGIEPFLLNSSLNIVLAQRLVRRLLPDCKEESTLGDELKKEVLTDLQRLDEKTIKLYNGVDLKNPHFFKGKQGGACGLDGFKGRHAICEVLEVSAAMKKIIAANAFSDHELVSKVLHSQQFVSMKQDGLCKALQGVTSVEEVVAITKEES